MLLDFVGSDMPPTATSVTEGVRGDFGWAFRLLSAVMTTLAVAALAKHAFVEWSLSAPMAEVLKAYKVMTGLLMGWAEPSLRNTE
jgi:hypothetical protein